MASEIGVCLASCFCHCFKTWKKDQEGDDAEGSEQKKEAESGLQVSTSRSCRNWRCCIGCCKRETVIIKGMAPVVLDERTKFGMPFTNRTVDQLFIRGGDAILEEEEIQKTNNYVLEKLMELSGLSERDVINAVHEIPEDKFLNWEKDSTTTLTKDDINTMKVRVLRYKLNLVESMSPPKPSEEKPSNKDLLRRNQKIMRKLRKEFGLREEFIQLAIQGLGDKFAQWTKNSIGVYITDEEYEEKVKVAVADEAYLYKRFRAGLMSEGLKKRKSRSNSPLSSSESPGSPEAASENNGASRSRSSDTLSRISQFHINSPFSSKKVTYSGSETNKKTKFKLKYIVADLLRLTNLNQEEAFRYAKEVQREVYNDDQDITSELIWDKLVNVVMKSGLSIKDSELYSCCSNILDEHESIDDLGIEEYKQLKEKIKTNCRRKSRSYSSDNSLELMNRSNRVPSDQTYDPVSGAGPAEQGTPEIVPVPDNTDDYENSYDNFSKKLPRSGRAVAEPVALSEADIDLAERMSNVTLKRPRMRRSTSDPTGLETPKPSFRPRTGSNTVNETTV